MSVTIDKTYLDIWNEYSSLEEEFKNIIQHIPLADEHMKVWSLKIGDILIVLGSVMDSFFKFSINHSIFDEVTNIQEIRSKSRLDMGDYREVFEKYYTPSNKYVYIRYMEKRIQPFDKWKTNSSLEWWEAYQHVKHDRFSNKKEATIENLLLGMTGFFLLNAIHIPSRIVLARRELWKDSYGNQYGPAFLENLLENNGPIQSLGGMLYLETDLFGHILDNGSKEYRDEAEWHKILKLLKEPSY